MKKLPMFFVSLFVTSLCGMELPCPIRNLNIGVNKPRKIAAVKKGVVAVLDKEYFTVREITTDKDIIKMPTFGEKGHFAIDQKAEKIALACDPHLTIFDAKTGEKEWQREIAKKLTIAFNPSNNSEVICFNNNLDNLYTCTESGEEYRTNLSVLMPHKISYNPADTEIFLSNNYSGGQILNYNTGHVPYAYENIILPGEYIVGHIYHPHGSCIAVMTRDNEATKTNIFIDSFPIKEMGFNKIYCSMLFHSNKNLFLLNCDNIIEYWDLEKKACCYTINCAYLTPPIPLRYILEERLALSSCGKKLFVALQNQCIEITLHPRIFLKNYNHLFLIWQSLRQKKKIPFDITYVIMKKLLKLSRTV